MAFWFLDKQPHTGLELHDAQCSVSESTACHLFPSAVTTSSRGSSGWLRFFLITRDVGEKASLLRKTLRNE